LNDKDEPKIRFVLIWKKPIKPVIRGIASNGAGLLGGFLNNCLLATVITTFRANPVI
jgi:hypothetical protein